MSAYGPPPASRSAGPAGAQQNATIVAYVAGGLGVLMFIWGFLKWFTEGSGDGGAKIGGYAVTSPATGAIACVLAAGLLVLLHTLDKKPVGLLPLVLSGTGLLLTLGVFIGKGSVSAGGSSENIGAGIGLILALITAILQTAALGYLHFGLRGGAGAVSSPASGWQSGGHGTPPGPSAGAGYGASGSAPTSGQAGSYGSPPGQPAQQGYPGQPPYGQYGGPQQRPPAPPYGQQPGSSPPPQPPSQPPPTQHLPAGPPASSPPATPSGPPPGQYGPPSEYGPPSQYGQPSQDPPDQYGPPQQR